MESTEFVVAGVDSAAPVTVGGPSMSLALPISARPDHGMSQQTMATIFGLSLILHVGLALNLRTNEKAPHSHRMSQVEIQVTHPPPPPKPVEIPPQETHPVAAPKVAAVAPRRTINTPPPIQAPPSAEASDSVPTVTEPEHGPVGLPSGDGTGEPVAAAPPPPPPPPAPIIQAKEGANYLKNPRPAYPRIAQREGWEGSILLRVHVLPNGRSTNISVQKSSGHKALDDAAVEAVGGWTFVPATQGGNPIEGWVTVPIDFRLQ
jgi:TonB family protein